MKTKKMLRNLRIVTSSVLSILIIVVLSFIFGLGFVIVLGIFFVTELAERIKKWYTY